VVAPEDDAGGEREQGDDEGERLEVHGERGARGEGWDGGGRNAWRVSLRSEGRMRALRRVGGGCGGGRTRCRRRRRSRGRRGG
jgi:hypothetical protein